MRHRRLATALLVAAPPLAAIALRAGAALGAEPRPGPRPQPRHHGRSGSHDDSRLPIVETATRQESYRLGAGGRLVVDGFAGGISARAVAGDTLRITVKETVRARDRESVARARAEMPLLLRQEGSSVIAYVDAPFRGPDGSWQGPHWELPYRVVYDFTVEVPRAVSVVLETVMDGDVQLHGTDGDFEVKNVNGEVTVTDVSGSGVARTVNGPLRVSFRRNPPGDCDFGTVNGDVVVDFQPGLAAAVRFRTLNGEAWSDFPFSVQPRRVAAPGERHDGRWRVHSRWSDGIRIGQGGPELSFETINGDILLRRRDPQGASR